MNPLKAIVVIVKGISELSTYIIKELWNRRRDKINKLNHVDMNEVEAPPTHFNQSPLN